MKSNRIPHLCGGGVHVCMRTCVFVGVGVYLCVCLSVYLCACQTTASGVIIQVHSIC